MCVFVCLNKCICVCVCVCVCVCLYECEYLTVCMSVCVCVIMCVFVCAITKPFVIEIETHTNKIMSIRSYTLSFVMHEGCHADYTWKDQSIVKECMIGRRRDTN